MFGGGDVCNSEKSVNSGFGKGYVYLSKSKNELKREFMNVKVNYKFNKVKIMVIHAMELDRNYYFISYSIINCVSKSESSFIMSRILGLGIKEWSCSLHDNNFRAFLRFFHNSIPRLFVLTQLAILKMSKILIKKWKERKYDVYICS